MALVRGVILRSHVRRIDVEGARAARRRIPAIRPSKATTSTVATKVKDGVMTSSPGFRSRAIMAICRASVPLAQAIVCFTPR